MKKIQELKTIERDKEGRINLDKLKEGIDYTLKDEGKGKRHKAWFVFEDGEVLVKRIMQDTYEDYSELLVEKLCEQLGFKSAHYDICTLNGKKYVITNNFVKEYESLVSGKTFMTTSLEILVENKMYIRKALNDQKELNNLEMIKKCLSIYLKDEDLEQVMASFDMLFALNCFCLNGDIHLSNWSVIYNAQSDIKYTLAPNYDAGSYFRFNLSRKNIMKHLRNLLRQKNMKHIIKILEDHIFRDEYNKNNSLNFCYESTEELGITRFEEAYRKESKRFDGIVQKLLKIDPYKAVDEVEKQIGVRIPEECSIWFVTVIEQNKKRLVDLQKEISADLEREDSYER